MGWEVKEEGWGREEERGVRRRRVGEERRERGEKFESSTNVFSCSGIYRICLLLTCSLVLSVHLNELVNRHLSIVSTVEIIVFF